jgi:hypothetical protein
VALFSSFQDKSGNSPSRLGGDIVNDGAWARVAVGGLVATATSGATTTTATAHLEEASVDPLLDNHVRQLGPARHREKT